MNDRENIRNDLVNALERVDVHDHLCLIYESLEEQLAAIIPFFKKGLKGNEQCVYIVDDNTAQTVLDAMRTEGIDIDSAIGSGALKVITKRDSYLKEGYFDPDLMIQFLKEAVDSAKKAGFHALRVTGEMTWALGSDPGDERLIEYEAKLNYFIPENDVLAICQYSRNRFSPEIIIDVIRTHPTVIYGSLVCENFYYVPPNEFLGPKNTQISMEVERLLKNIRDYERAEKSLREVSLYTRSLIEASLDPLVTISLDGKITDVNIATELVTGVSREKLIGKDFSDYFTTPEKARKGYHEVFEKGFVRDYPLAIRHISGRITDVLYNASVYRDAAGNIAGVFAAARDITERKKAQEAHLRLASIVEFSEDAIIGKTMDGIIVSWNPGAEKLYGYCENEVIGKTISILIPPGHFDEMPTILERIKWGEIIEHYEAVRIRKDGKKIDVSLTISPIKDAQGRIIGASTIARDITEHKKIEKQLRDASLYVRNLIEASLDPLVTISPEGKITDVNEATESVTGISREELIGSDFSDYFTEPEKSRKGYQEVFEKGFVTDYPLAIRHKSGNITDVLYNAAVYKNEAGEVQGVFAAARDITKRKRAEEQLRITSLYSRNLIEASLDPLVTISSEGKITDVNKGTELVTGVSREELIGSDFSNYFTEPKKARKGYQEVFEKGFVRDYPLAIRHKSGNISDVLYNATVYKNEKGEVQGVFAAARDITQRKRAEEQLRIASLYARNLIETSLDPLVTISSEGKITDVNNATELVTGVSREELIGSDFSDYFTEREKARKGYHEVFEKGLVRDYPLAIRHISGKITEVLYNATVYKNETGEVQGVFAAARDITERKHAENELQKAHDELEIRVRERTSELAQANEALKAEITEREKAQESLIRSLAEKELLIKEVHHRVKNNLQIVSSMLELQSTYMKDKQAIMAFREGQNRVSTMALIHEKLYRSGDLSRIRFAEYIEELTSNIFVSYGVNSDQIRLNINVGEVFFDINTAIPCGLIINELVSNSIKHAFKDGRKGEINIELRPENREKYLLTINDNGRGFPQDLDFRNSETLGLKLVITLTKQLNGTIELDRTAGTRFTIIFSELKYKER